MISDLSNEPIKHALQRIELMDEVQRTLLEEFEPGLGKNIETQ